MAASQSALRENPLEPALVRTLDSRIEEATGLARAIDLDVREALGVPVRTVRPATLFGKGKVEELAALIASSEAGLAIIDHALSPVQQQNLETAWNCKILDRTALILEIFGERAQTKEGRAQVELAHLNYQKGRLVRSWTHLERQRGGLGFVGGPGETQIESDRRMIARRIKQLEAQLEKTRRTRKLHRAKRQKVPHPVVALVGYTNAGKSTLFNQITGAEVFAEDQLFATLDPTLRQLDLPQGTRVILSDTVGFVSNLPTHLIAAFRATLEEVIEADLIIHVRDIFDSDSDAQSVDVYHVMQQLGINTNDQGHIIEAWNKIDLLGEEQRQSISRLRTGHENGNEPVLISSITGEGVEELLAQIEQRISGGKGFVEITLDIAALARLNWLYENTIVLEREDNEDGSVSLKLRVKPDLIAQVEALDREPVEAV
ncbi:MAG: GTPase HflX [Rhizobiaceae bacterium]|nr:GTPase HflX [Rhizobiaceae bacterium]